MGRGHLGLLFLALALATAAAAPAAAAPRWRELARGTAAEPVSATEATVFPSAVRASADARLPPDAHRSLAGVDWTSTVVVAVFGEFGCSDRRVVVASVSRSGPRLIVTVVKQPLLPGSVECQAIFPTYRLLAVSRASLEGATPTAAIVRWQSPKAVPSAVVAAGTTVANGNVLHGYVAAKRADETAWASRLTPDDGDAAAAVSFATHSVVAVFLDDAPCASDVAAAVTRSAARVTVRVTYTRPPVGVATCVRTSTSYLVLSVPRVALAGAHISFVSVARA